MDKPDNISQTRAEIIRKFLPTSPFSNYLGVQLLDMQPDMAILELPFANALREEHRQGSRYLQAWLN